MAVMLFCVQIYDDEREIPGEGPKRHDFDYDFDSFTFNLRGCRFPVARSQAF